MTSLPLNDNDVLSVARYGASGDLSVRHIDTLPVLRSQCSIANFRFKVPEVLFIAIPDLEDVFLGDIFSRSVFTSVCKELTDGGNGLQAATLTTR